MTACVLSSAAGSCRQNMAEDSGRPKLVILGFDGMDPNLVREFVARGQMPAFAQLMRAGGLRALETTASPESPAAWASFATGVNPGKHNIYDFLVRDPATYRPGAGMTRTQPPTFLFDWIPTSRPHVTSLRGGTSFWVTAGRAGVRSTILTVPLTFPPEDVPNGELVSGLPVPDIRGTMGTFSYFATDLRPSDEGHSEFGGIVKRLTFNGDTATATLVGPRNPIVPTEDVTLPMTIKWTRGTDRASIRIGSEAVTLVAGAWSKWINVDFRINVFVRLHGMVQLYLVAGDEMRLYVSPVNIRPDAPPVPISAPASLAADIARRMGPFRTLGWAEPTWPLNEERLDEKAFMDDVYRAFDDRAQVILDRLTKRRWDLFVGVIESTDRVQHMMYRLIDPNHPMYDKDLAARYGDSILRIYRRADQLVDQVSELVEPGTTILVVSDHGFHTWRKAVNLNTWLVEHGYMALQGPAPGEKKLDDLYGAGEFWQNVDWSKTRAYAMGLGQIYFNVRGREAHGIVNPGQEASALADELASKLRSELVDAETKTQVVRAVYKRNDVYSGEFLDQAADLQVAFEDGYRVSWQTTLGGAPQGVMVPNMRKWSGDHAGYDYKTTAGVLLSNVPLNTDTPRIVDLAPTVLDFFGVPAPSGLDGKPLLRK